MSHSFEAPKKDPQAELRHAHNLADWLADDETIVAQSVTAEDGITVDRVSEENGVVSYWISGGEAGREYIVTCEVTTSLGRTDQRSARYRVRER